MDTRGCAANSFECPSIDSLLLMTLSWNLMSRVSNTLNLHVSHMQWINDALGVFFGVMKNDQLAELPRDPRHVYSNPLQPHICPILSLAIHLMSLPNVLSSQKIFQGNSPEDRYSETIKTILTQFAEEAMTYGLSSKTIGTHSVRKGSATYAAVGCTSAPSIVSICRRTGWSMPTIQATYFRYEAAGDQFVGRVAAGLPVDSEMFAVMPPTFAQNSPLINHAIRLAFPQLHVNQSIDEARFMPVAKYLLASVVFHEDWLRQNLPDNHPLFQNRLFADMYLEQLKPFVSTSLSTTGATGIPPLVTLMKSESSTRRRIEELSLLLEQLPTKISVVIDEAFERHTIQGQTVTPQGVMKLFHDALATYGLDKLAEKLSNPLPPPPSVSEPVRQIKLHPWGKGLHPVPKDFDWPSKPSPTLLQAWLLYCCGDPSRGYPPYRYLKPSDMSTPNKAKRLSQFRAMLDTIATSAAVTLDDISADDAITIFNQHVRVLNISPATKSGRTRRVSELAWITIASEMEPKSRKPRAQEDPE